MEVGKGRLAIFADSGLFSGGTAGDNPQFVLNVMHWLSRALSPPVDEWRPNPPLQPTSGGTIEVKRTLSCRSWLSRGRSLGLRSIQRDELEFRGHSR
jgi:hypothetical protein